MGWYWNALGVAGISLAVVAFGFALVVFFTRPERPQNRRLALVLLLEAITGVGGGGIVYVTTKPSVAFGAQVMTFMAFSLTILAYLAFLATLATPLVRPLRGRLGDLVLVVAAAGTVLVFLLRSPAFTAGVEPAQHAAWEGVEGPWLFPFVIVPSLAVLFFGLLAAVSMWRRARPGGPVRRQGAAYATAFAVRDAGWLLFLVTTFAADWGFGAPTTWILFGTQAAYYVLLAYGILQTQLFEIDLGIKIALQRSTVVAAFALVFLVASEVVEGLLVVDGWVFGLAAAVALGLGFRRIEGAAARLADRVMPSVEDTAVYRRERGIELYRAAFESACLDGEVTSKERAVLATLRERLVLDEARARDIERVVLADRAGVR